MQSHLGRYLRKFLRKEFQDFYDLGERSKMFEIFQNAQALGVGHR